MGNSGGGGGSTRETVSTTTQQLSKEQQKIFKPVIPIAERFAETELTLPEGTGIVGFDPREVRAQRAALDVFRPQQTGPSVLSRRPAGPGAQLLERSRGLQNFLLEDLIQGDNPALRAAIDAANRATTDTFTSQVLPNLRTTEVELGQTGGSRGRNLEGLLVRDLNRTLADNAATIAQEDLKNRITGAVQSQLLVPQLLNLEFLPSQIESDVGFARRQLAQAQEAAAREKFATEQLLESRFPQAQLVSQLVFGAPGGGTTSQGTSSGGPTGSGISPAQGLISGAGLASAILPIIFGL